MGSVAVVYRLSCPVVHGTFPDQGLNPCPLHWQVDSQLLDHQGSPPNFFSRRFEYHEKILEEIIVENFPKMGKEIATQVQKTQRVPNR